MMILLGFDLFPRVVVADGEVFDDRVAEDMARSG